MSVSAAVLGSLADTEARSTYTCALGQAPTANNLILVGVLVSDTAGTPVEPTGVIGAGMVFSLITSSVTYNGAVASELHNLSAWRSMSAKSAISEDNGASSAITIVGPSATSTANAWLSLLGISASGSTDTPGHNWSFLESTGYGTPATGIKSAWTTLSTGTVATWIGPGAERRGAIMIELVADNPPAAGVAVTYNRMERIPERIPAVPSNIQGPIRDYLEVVRRQLNAEAYISKFSGTDPNTSGVSGVPGSLVVNVGSASTATRLWLKKGAAQSVSTISWVPLRVA
jgi:hypothetical protein